MPLNRASECVKKGLWIEAWNALQELSITDRLTHEVFRIRLECCINLGRWEYAETLVQLLGEQGLANQLAIFRYYHAAIAHLLSLGKIEQAREAAQKAIRVWPEGKSTLEEDPLLKQLWRICVSTPRTPRAKGLAKSRRG